MVRNQIIEGGRRKLGFDSSQRIKPKLTIITVILNGGNRLCSIIENVLFLKREDIEFLIIDGGSDDSTLDILRHYDAQIDYWISERDNGIYDAMNKGLALSRGDYIYHLNIGDKLLKIPSQLWAKNNNDISCFSGRVQTGCNKVFTPKLGWRLRLHNTLHHQGNFYKRGPELHYDLRYKVFSDFDLNQRLVKFGHRIELCSDLVAVHEQDGISHSPYYFNEVYAIILNNEGPLWMILAYIYFKLCGVVWRLNPNL
jgi:glycosyltransferase involved in cell wall biosynthesis